MLTFPNSFFDEECRNGFCIEPMMKKAWAAELETLSTFQSVCEKNGLTFWMYAGTLLGAVRHRGFIPWDDDVDVAMPREDYQKLLQLPPTELPGDYHLLSPHNRDYYPDVDNSFCNTLHIHKDDVHLRQFHGFPYPVGIDIFPFDNITDEEQDRAVHFQLLDIINSVKIKLSREELSPEETESYLMQIEHLCGVTISRSQNIPNRLARLLDQLSQIYNDVPAARMGFLTTACQNSTRRMEKHWYRETVMLPFESLMLPAPVDYDAVLTRQFGDYKTCVQEPASHDYPFYKKYQ